MKPYLDEAWLYLEYVSKRRIQKDIGSQYGVTHQRIAQLVKKFKLMEARNALHKPYMNKDWLAGEFVDKRRTQPDIADECGVCVNTIAIWVARYKLKRKFFTKEERTQRNVAHQNRLYATDPEYRRKKIERAHKWQQQNSERWNKYLRDRYKRLKEEAANE